MVQQKLRTQLRRLMSCPTLNTISPTVCHMKMVSGWLRFHWTYKGLSFICHHITIYLSLQDFKYFIWQSCKVSTRWNFLHNFILGRTCRDYLNWESNLGPRVHHQAAYQLDYSKPRGLDSVTEMAIGMKPYLQSLGAQSELLTIPGNIIIATL